MDCGIIIDDQRPVRSLGFHVIFLLFRPIHHVPSRAPGPAILIGIIGKLFLMLESKMADNIESARPKLLHRKFRSAWPKNLLKSR